MITAGRAELFRGMAMVLTEVLAAVLIIAALAVVVLIVVVLTAVAGGGPTRKRAPGIAATEASAVSLRRESRSRCALVRRLSTKGRIPAAGIIARRDGSSMVLAGFAGVVTVEVLVRRLRQIWNVVRGDLLKVGRRVARRRLAVPVAADGLTTRAADRVKAGWPLRDQVTVVVPTVVDLAVAVSAGADLKAVVSVAVMAATLVVLGQAAAAQVVPAPVQVLVAVVAGSAAEDLAEVDPAAAEILAAEVAVAAVEAAVAAVDKVAAVAASLRA